MYFEAYIRYQTCLGKLIGVYRIQDSSKLVKEVGDFKRFIYEMCFLEISRGYAGSRSYF
jgi:hypothetical protein